MQNRQADADFYARLLAELESQVAALHFRSDQDALDYARHSSEVVARSLAPYRLNALDRHIEGDVGCYVRLHSRLGDQDCDLTFFRVPLGGFADWDPSEPDNIAGVEDRSLVNLERNKGAVFLGVTELVQAPQGIIPSFVWIEPAEERCDFRWQIATPPAIVDMVVQVEQRVSEREISAGALGIADGILRAASAAAYPA